MDESRSRKLKTGGLKTSKITQEYVSFTYQIHKAVCSLLHRATYNALEAHLIRLDQHLTNKQHTLMTDLRCLDMRDTLKTGNMAPPATETDRNIQLTKMEEEV